MRFVTKTHSSMAEHVTLAIGYKGKEGSAAMFEAGAFFDEVAKAGGVMPGGLTRLQYSMLLYSKPLCLFL
jgi:hypothetical protein